jgi:hypothetical protein
LTEFLNGPCGGCGVPMVAVEVLCCHECRQRFADEDEERRLQRQDDAERWERENG